MPKKVKCFIICPRLLDENMKLVIGGLEKYIADLGGLLAGAGYEVVVCQHSRENFTAGFRGFTVAGVKSGGKVGGLLDWIGRNTDEGGGGKLLRGHPHIRDGHNHNPQQVQACNIH